MSDIEEPPNKVTKYEMSQTYTQEEELEEGQEEWLSEGLLTDDDFNPENPDNSATDPDKTRSDLDTPSQGVPEDNIDESMQENHEELQDSQGQEIMHEEVLQEELLEDDVKQEQSADGTVGDVTHESTVLQSQNSSQIEDSNIERTLNSMDNAPDELDSFLMKNEGEKTKQVKAEESDGNDTDDLLRMLEDDDKSKKVKTKVKTVVKKEKAASSDEENENNYIFHEGLIKLRLNKSPVAGKPNVLRKIPTKAEPESSDDETSGEERPVRKTYTRRPGPKVQQKQEVAKQVVRIGNSNTISFKPTKEKRPPVSSTPIRQYHNSARGKSILKSTLQRPVVKVVERPVDKKNERKQQDEHEEIINEEEFLEDEDFDLGEDFAEESDSELDKRAVRQRIMQPERMDEDMLSDAESQSDDPSLYDELPSSDSELEDWFTFDLRGERAGEYLPMLGNRAYDLLLQEKQRVSSRLATLRDNLNALNSTGRQQAERLKRATAALADVDDMLKAA